MPIFDTTKLSVQISPQIHIKNNDEVLDTVSQKWNQWLGEFTKEYMKIHGVVKDIWIDSEDKTANTWRQANHLYTSQTTFGID